MVEAKVDVPTPEERIADLEVRLSEIVAACAWLHRSITEATEYAIVAQKLGLSAAFRSPDAGKMQQDLMEAGSRLDEALSRAKGLIWKDGANGGKE